MPKREKACGDCIHCHSVEDQGAHECRFNPPRKDYDWPCVEPDGWCSQFSNRAEDDFEAIRKMDRETFKEAIRVWIDREEERERG